jgi:membrane-associated phospholipid phosphatase
MNHAAEAVADPLAVRLRTALQLGVAVAILFLVVYGGADWLTGRHAFRVPVAMTWERQIPYIPAAVLGYMSMYPLFALAPFVLKTVGELRQFAKALALLIAVAGAVFVFLPAELAYDPLPAPGIWRPLVDFADALNLRYNLAPSLHVGFSVACAAAYAPNVVRWQAAMLWLWALVVAVSTLLFHEHHVVDVVSGWVLALLCVRWTCGSRATASNPPAQDHP